MARERERAYLNLRPVSPKPTKHLTLSLQVELVPESGVMIAKAAKAMAKIKARGNPKLLVKELLERIIPPHELAHMSVMGIGKGGNKYKPIPQTVQDAKARK